MSEEEKTLLMIRGEIAGRPEDQQIKVQEIHAVLEVSEKEFPEETMLAVALYGVQKQLENA